MEMTSELFYIRQLEQERDKLKDRNKDLEIRCDVMQQRIESARAWLNRLKEGDDSKRMTRMIENAVHDLDPLLAPKGERI